MSTQSSYDEFSAEVSKLMSKVSTLQRQVQAYALDPYFVEMPAPELFTGTYDGKMITNFLNACDMYFKLFGISDENTTALFAKTRLSDIAHTWYDSQGYDETMVTFATVKSHILDYVIPFDYIRRAKRALVACKIEKRLAKEYIDDFRKHLVN